MTQTSEVSAPWVEVRANAARALGHLVSAADFIDAGTEAAAVAASEQPPSAWLSEVIQALMSCLTTGNAKVQWNACHAMGALFRNPTTAAAGSSWSPLARVIPVCSHPTVIYKPRLHSSAYHPVPPMSARMNRHVYTSVEPPLKSRRTNE